MLLTLAPLSPMYGEAPSEFISLLRNQLGNSSGNLAERLDKEVVAVIVPHSAEGEIVAVGAVRIPVTLDFFVNSFRNIAEFKKSAATQAIAHFGDPLSPRDLSGMTLGSFDRNALSGCVPGNCNLKLSAAMISALRAPGGASVDQKFRKLLWEYVASYVQRGTPGMIDYADKKTPVHASAEFRGLLARFSWVPGYAQPLAHALNAPYEKRAGQVEQFFYWSEEDLSLKPLISITHVFVYKTNIGGHDWAFLASKQIYADHYLNGSLGLTVLAEETKDPDHPMLNVAYFNRTVVDGLRGWFASLQRSLVERRIRSAVEKNMTDMRQRLIAAHRDAAMKRREHGN
ncbi:MAG: hypothetical protein ABJC09_10255 [Terriglobia bacterium]